MDIVSCCKILISSLNPFNNPMETEPLKNSGHGGGSDILQMAVDIFSLHSVTQPLGLTGYTMAKHTGPQIPNEVDEWLDGFN